MKRALEDCNHHSPRRELGRGEESDLLDKIQNRDDGFAVVFSDIERDSEATPFFKVRARALESCRKRERVG